MNIYFTASIAGKKLYLQNYQTILDSIQSQNHTIIADHIINTTEEEIHLETSEERRDFHKRLDQWITSADAVVAEITFPSISVGFEISRALEKGKPVLALYSEGLPPSLLPELNTERLIVEKYDAETLPEIISEYLRYVNDKHETKFTLLLSDELTSYLTKMSRIKNTSKSAYIRHLILQDQQHQTS
jgi:hypothetical protein